MSGIITFIVLIFFVIPITLIIDHYNENKRAKWRHDNFPNLFPDRSRPARKHLSKAEKELDRQIKARQDEALAEYNRFRREFDKNIRDIFYENYVEPGDVVELRGPWAWIDGNSTLEHTLKIRDEGYHVQYCENEMTGWVYPERIPAGTYVVRFDNDDTKKWRVVKTGLYADEEFVNVLGGNSKTYWQGERPKLALCENPKDGHKTICAFEDIRKCDSNGNVIYENIYDWAKEKEKRLNEATRTRPGVNPEDYARRDNLVRRALGFLPTRIQPSTLDFGYCTIYYSPYKRPRR